MHWINFPLLSIMIWSGLRIYWADVRDPYGFGIGLIGWHWFDFLPDFVNERLELERKLAKGLAFHFTFGWLFVINGLLYVLYTAVTGEWRHLLPNRQSLPDAGRVLLHDLTLGRTPLPPQGRYNAAQRLSYTLIVALGGVAVATGFAIYKPTQLNMLTTAFGGYESARTIHFAATIIFLMFFVVHIAQVVRAGRANFTSMVTGYEPITAEAADAPSDPNSGSHAAPATDPAPTSNGTPPSPVLSPSAYQSQSRRAVLTGVAATAASVAGWRWLQGRPLDNRAIDVLRRGHELNQGVWETLYRGQTMAPTFDRSKSSELRVNGRKGLESAINLDRWELQVLGPDGELLGTHTMEDILALPKVSMTVEHKCVEGWSHIVTWGGTPFGQFIAPYFDQLGRQTPYVYAETPDREYYVGVDTPAMLHAQTLLCYELEDQPLSLDHGAPLRLTTPNKYGIKQIKRIGTIALVDEQPTDYWYERGYDWYAQL